MLAGGLLVCSVSAAALAIPDTVQVSPDLEVIPLTDGVWRHRSWNVLGDGTRFPSNGLLVRDGDVLVLMDTAWGDSLTEALLVWADSALAWPIARAIATHSHDDRVGGAAALARRGIPLHVSPATHRRLSIADAAHATMIRRLRSPGSTARVGSLEVFAMGAAHAPDNIAVWLPGPRVLFGGCAVRAAASRSLGNLADADTLAWVDAIFRLSQRYGGARIVVPGHGEPGGPDLLGHTRSLLPRSTHSP